MQTRQAEQDDRIDRVLRAGDRASSAPPELAEHMLLAHAARVASARSSRRRRWLLAPTAVTAALVAGLSATGALPAFADTVQHFVAETGIFGDGLGPHGAASSKHYSEMDDSEWVDLTAPDFVPYAEQLMPTYITLPNSVPRSRFARDVARVLAVNAGTGKGAVMQVTGVRRSFEADAACVWYQTWEDAAHDGNTALAHQAAAQYGDASTWREIVATDGGGVVASMRRVHALAAAGDWTGARAELGIDCTRADVAAVTR